jgi:hypothetical protein
MSQFIVKNYTLNLLRQNSLKSLRCSSAGLSSFANKRTIDQNRPNESNLNIVLSHKHLKQASLYKQPFNNSIIYSASSQIRYFHNSRYVAQKDDNSSSSSSGDGNDGNDNKNDGGSNPHEDVASFNDPNAPNLPPLLALAPIQIPENFPKVPLVAIPRNPLFPNFIKMLEVRFIQNEFQTK